MYQNFDKKIRYDAELVMKESRFCLEIDERGRVISRNDNKNGKLNVISIVGPTENKKFKKAVLLEVGISRTRPYHNTLFLTARKKKFNLSVRQYSAIRGAIFNIIKNCAEERICRWENPMRTIRTKTCYLQRGRKKFTERNRFKACPVGARFSISLKDEFLLNDFKKGELDNPLIAGKLEKLTRFFDLCLNHGKYVKDEYSLKQLRAMMKASNGGVSSVASVLEDGKLMPHYLSYILNQGRIKKRNLFMQIVECAYGRDMKEKIEQGYDPLKEATADSSLLIFSPQKNRKEGSDFHVFEVAMDSVLAQSDAERLF